jgi:glycosyltransferase involved in cell wall biosynthesis
MKSNYEPSVSIIIPCFNASLFIRDCINSILSQTYSSIEIIVIDDNSTDGSINIVKDISAANKNITLMQHFSESNLGPSSCRNIGIQKANGDFLLFVDADDGLVSNAIEEMVCNYRINNIDLVICGYTELFKDGTVGTHVDFKSVTDTSPKEDFALGVLQGTGGVVWGKLYRKKLIDRYNIKFNPLISMCEDISFNLEYILRCQTFIVTNKYLYIYNRRNENSITNNLDISEFKKQFNVQLEINRLLVQFRLTPEVIDTISCTRMNRHLDAQLNRIFSMSQKYLKIKPHLGNLIKLVNNSELFISGSNNVLNKFLLIIISSRRIFLVYLFFIIIYKTKNSNIRQLVAKAKRGFYSKSKLL